MGKANYIIKRGGRGGLRIRVDSGMRPYIHTHTHTQSIHYYTSFFLILIEYCFYLQK